MRIEDPFDPFRVENISASEPWALPTAIKSQPFRLQRPCLRAGYCPEHRYAFGGVGVDGVDGVVGLVRRRGARSTWLAVVHSASISALLSNLLRINPSSFRCKSVAALFHRAGDL